MINPYAILGALLLALAAYFGGIHTGAKLEHEKWQVERLALVNQSLADVQAEVNKRQHDDLVARAASQKVVEKYERQITDQQAAHDASVAAIRRAGGLRIPAPAAAKNPAAAPAEAAGAVQPDEALAGTIQLPERVEERLYALTWRAAQVTMQCRALQQWVIDQGFYGSAPAEPKTKGPPFGGPATALLQRQLTAELEPSIALGHVDVADPTGR